MRARCLLNDVHVDCSVRNVTSCASRNVREVLFLLFVSVVRAVCLHLRPRRPGSLRCVFEQPVRHHGFAEHLRHHRAGGEPAALSQACRGARARVRGLQDAARVRPHQGQHRRELAGRAVSHRRGGRLELVGSPTSGADWAT